MSDTYEHATQNDVPPLLELPPAEMPRGPFSDRILSGVGTALDSAILRAMQFVVERALIPDPEDLEALRESARPMLAPALQAEPRRFFAFLDEPPHTLRMESRHRRRLARGSALSRRIESDYVPFTAGMDASDGPILVEHWVHEPPRRRATVVALHGFTMGNPRIDSIILMAHHWFERGLDVALLTLPHHGRRTPALARFSGEHFAVPHFARLGEAVREAVYEIRQVVHWLREETGAPVGVLGLSLGGYLAALCGGLCDDLAFVVPIVPPASIGDLAWRFFTGTHHFRAGRTPAISRADLIRACRIHSPLSHPLRLPRERALIVAGRGDRIVPPEHPTALWRHWGEPDIHWFSGSHVAPFSRRRVARRIIRHLESVGVV